MVTYALAFINTVQLPEFQDWTDQYGMILDTFDGGVGGNGNLFTAHYVIGLVLKNIITDAEKARIIQVYLNNFKQPGLLVRAPSKWNDYNAHDDIVGLMGADALLNPDTRPLTNAVYNYGKNTSCDGIDETRPNSATLNKILYYVLKVFKLGKVNWVWNTSLPGKFDGGSWLGRRMEVTATMKMSLKKFMWFKQWLYWAISMLSLYLSKPDAHDAYILRFQMAIAAKGYGFFTDLICGLIRKKVEKDFGDFGQLLGAYFNKPNHPLVALLKGIY